MRLIEVVPFIKTWSLENNICDIFMQVDMLDKGRFVIYTKDVSKISETSR